MRLPLFVVLSAAAGLGACVPPPEGPYGTGYAQPAPAYGYYDQGYAPGPYYAEPGYAVPVAPGPTIIVGGERERYRDDRYRADRYRDERYRDERRFRENQARREPDRGPPPREERRPGPPPIAAARPAPAPQPDLRRAPSDYGRPNNGSPFLGDQNPR